MVGTILASRPPMRLRGLRTWLVLLVVVATALGLALVLREHSEERERFESELRSMAANLARSVAAAEQAKLDDAKGFVSGLAELPSVKAHDAEACSRIFTALCGRYPVFANFGAATPDGSIFCSGVSSRTRTNIADREYFRRVMASRAPAVGEHVIGRKTGVPSVHVAVPSFDTDGKIVAVVYAAIDLRAMSSRLERFPVPPGATLTVVDRYGAIL